MSAALPGIWNNVRRPPLIKSRVWAKREEREKEGGRAEEDDAGCGGDRDAAADGEEEGKSERAAEGEGDLSASVHVVT